MRGRAHNRKLFPIFKEYKLRMENNLIILGVVLIVAGFALDRLDLSGNLKRLASIASKLLKTIGVIVVIAGFANR